MFQKVKTWISSHWPTRRRIIQLYAALLFNANLKGFATGRIYTGPLKNMCYPGLNCYSCPGAGASCPMGALQNALSGSKKSTPYFMFGILLLWGLLFGRWICGFLCPFGLVQDLLYKIKTPKLKKGRWSRVLSYFKYAVLVFFVIVVPLAFLFKDLPLPGFCKYICPAGTLGGAISLLFHPDNSGMFAMLGHLFTWKFALLLAIVIGAVFIYRFFCRFFCPLGAIYGLFNKIAFFGVQVDAPKCTDCGRCVARCKMDIRRVGDHECISCGDCLDVCPTKAISYKGGKFLLDPGELPADAPPTQLEQHEKRKKRNKILRTVAWCLAIALLSGALVYYNLIDKIKTPVTPPDSQYGIERGDTLKPQDLPLIGDDTSLTEDGKYSIADGLGKITVLNFWSTTCIPCVAELPHFSEFAAQYKDRATVISVHTNTGMTDYHDFVKDYFMGSDIVFVYDEQNDYYPMFGVDTIPLTVILDAQGVILEVYQAPVSYETLVSYME